MTPKEKAKELYWKFFEAQAKENEPYVCDGEIAINCALIAVDEILSIMNRSIQHFVPHFGGGGHTVQMPNQEYQYWQKVKQEIQNL